MASHKYKILSMFSLCSFLPPFINSSLNLAIPFIGKQFGMNIVSMGWITTAFLLSTAVLLVPMGQLADIAGRKKVFLYGVFLFTLASATCGLAHSGGFLITIRALQGIGHAMMFGTTMTLLVSTFPPRERGRALGINIAGIYLGNSIGPVLGGFITHYLGWQYIFIIAALLGALVVLMGIMYLNLKQDYSRDERFDLIGSLLYAASVVALLYGTTLLPSLLGLFVIGTGITLLIAFCILEDYIEHPVFDVRLLLKNRRFAFSSLAALLNFSASYAVPLLISLYLQYGLNISAQTTGLFLLLAAITVTLASPISGRLADHYDARGIAIFGLALAATSLAVLGLSVTTTTSPLLIALCLTCFGTGLGFFASPNTHAAMESVSARHVSLASSLLSTMRSFGQTLSLGISMLVLSLIAGKIQISTAMVPQLIQSVRITLFVFCSLFIIGIFATLAQGKGYQPGEEQI